VEYDHSHPNGEKQSRGDVSLAKRFEAYSPNIKFRIYNSKDFNIFHVFNGNSIAEKAPKDGDTVIMEEFTVKPKQEK